MTDRSGVVYDLGYQPYAGERLGRRGAVLAVLRDGLRRVMGLRRRARRKILPWGLFVLALLPAGFFVAFSVFTGELLLDEFNRPVELFGAADYSSFSATFTLLFVALAATELLLPDRTSGTLEVYASRPLSFAGYLGARTGALGALVIAFLMVPQALIMLGNAFVSPDGFLPSIIDDLDVIARALAATFVYFLAFAPPALAVASVVTNAGVAAGMFIAGVVLINFLAEFMLATDFEYLTLLAINHHPRYLGDWIFGEDTLAWIPERAGFDPWVSLTVIAAVALASAIVLIYRYRSWL